MSKGPDKLTLRLGGKVRARSALAGVVATILFVGPLSIVLAQTSTSYEQNLATIEKMNDSQKRILRDRYETFKKLDGRERDELLKKHKKIHEHPDAARLQKVMERYYEWFANQRSGVQKKIRDLPNKKSVQEISEWYERQRESREDERFRRALKGLKEPDSKVFRDWMGDYLKNNERAMFELLSPDAQKLFEAGKKRFENRRPNKEKPDSNAHSKESRFRRIGIGILMGMLRREGKKLPPPTNEELAKLRKQLSAEGAKKLMGDASQADQWEQLKAWIQDAGPSGRQGFGPRKATDEELKTFYLNLDEDRRSYLDSLPVAEMRKELQDMYNRDRFGPGRSRPGERRGPGRSPPDGRHPEGRSGPPGRSRGDRGRGPKPPRHHDIDR